MNILARQLRLRLLFGSLGLLAGVAVSVWLLDGDGTHRYSREAQRVAGWIGIVVGGAGGLNLLGALARPAMLVTMPSGFVVRRWRGEERIGWNDLDRLWVYALPMGEMVVWKRRPGADGHGLTAWLDRPFGYDGSLGLGWLWDRRCRSIARELLEARDRYEGRNSKPAPSSHATRPEARAKS